MRKLTTALASAWFVLILPAFASAQATRPPVTAEDILKVTSISVLDLSDDGQRVAASARTSWDNPETDYRRYGDPSYLNPSRVTLLVIDTRTGATQKPFKGLASVRRAAWSPDGKRLAILTADDENGLPASHLFVWDVDRSVLTEVPRQPGVAIAANSDLDWTPDGARLAVALRTPEQDREARARFKAITEGPVIVQKAGDPFLEWDALGRMTRDREIVELDVRTGRKTTLVAGRKISSYDLARDGSFLTFLQDVTTKTDYEVIGGTDNDLMLLKPGGEPTRVAPAKDLKETRLQWSDDGRWFAYARKGEVFVQSVDDEKPRSLTPRPPEKKEGETEKKDEKPGADEKQEPESFSVGPFSADASKLLITSKKGWYAVTVADGARQAFVTLEEDEQKNPRLSAIAWTPDGRGVYATYGERAKWDRGIVRIDVATKTMTPLVKDGRLYTGVQLSRDGSTFVMSLSNGDNPSELYVVDANAGGGTSSLSVRQLTSLNDWVMAKALPRSELIAYRDADGKELYGVLRYPVDYVKGQKYPTVFEIYEMFFDNGFNGRAAFLAGRGYAVFHPSVNLVVGRPGESWVKGVTAAANRLIEMGVADPDRLGVHGTSYGGYATVLLLTQTDRFKAAVNISGKVDMVSFYTDSPRLGVRNTHAPEKSQDRIGGTLWEYPERYLEHSAILHADRIKTPLLCITGDQDPNVPASQSREIYYALRRLGKEVEWVRYVNGGHRPPNSNAESIDFEERIAAWYDKYLKKKDEKKTSSY
jgi:dipeptidyl aminopeptidase/acylaminoacyl peptidase